MIRKLVVFAFVAVVLILASAPEFEWGHRACTADLHSFLAQVVDDDTGTNTRGAYWRSETLRGEVLRESLEDGDHERYLLVHDNDVLGERLTEAAKVSARSDSSSYGSASEPFRVILAKEGYVTIVRELTAIWDICHVRGVEGDTEFRMVKGPPGKDNIFRNPR